jgi:uncharacterized protein YprB with RNaseH-like and TPR domain
MLFIDIETVPNPDMTNLLPEIKPPGSYKKPESIKKWMAENGEAAKDEQVAKMALDPLMFRIRAIGVSAVNDPFVYTLSDAGVVSVYTISNAAEEKDILEMLWNIDFELPWIGYNILGFDIPRLLMRSMMLGVTPPRKFSLKRYATDEVIDLMMLLKGWDSRTTSMAGMGLKQVCKVLGIPNDLPDADGSQVAFMSDEELIEYSENDVRLTQALYLRMLGIYF